MRTNLHHAAGRDRAKVTPAHHPSTTGPSS